MRRKKSPKKAPEILHVGPEGEEIPARLVADLKTHWEEIETVRIKRRSKVLATVPVIVAPSVEGIEASTLMDVAAQAYAHATEHAESDGDGLFTFEGLGRVEDEHVVQIIFRRSLRVVVDQDGEPTSEESDPTARVIEVCAATVEKFGGLATRAINDQINQHDAYMGGLKVLRQQLIEQARQMRELDEKALRRDELAMEHTQQMARIESMGNAFAGALTAIAPQLATMFAQKSAGSESSPGSPPSPPPGQRVHQEPCAEAAQLQRVLERMGDKMDAFRDQFRDDRWCHVESAMGARTTQEFDAGIRHLFLSHGITEQEEALKVGSEWFKDVPGDAKAMAIPAMVQCAQRLKWPLKS